MHKEKSVAEDRPETMMELYKIIVSSYESSRQQRFTLNQTFVFLFSAIIGMYNFLMGNDVSLPQTELSYSIFSIGLVVCVFWSIIIMQGVKAEKNKYGIIYKIEGDMPVRLLSVSLKEKNKVFKDKIFAPGYLELALPFFMMAVLSVNLVLFAKHSNTINPF